MDMFADEDDLEGQEPGDQGPVQSRPNVQSVYPQGREEVRATSEAQVASSAVTEQSGLPDPFDDDSLFGDGLDFTWTKPSESRSSFPEPKSQASNRAESQAPTQPVGGVVDGENIPSNQQYFPNKDIKEEWHVC